MDFYSKWSPHAINWIPRLYKPNPFYYNVNAEKLCNAVGKLCNTVGKRFISCQKKQSSELRNQEAPMTHLLHHHYPESIYNNTNWIIQYYSGTADCVLPNLSRPSIYMTTILSLHILYQFYLLSSHMPGLPLKSWFPCPDKSRTCTPGMPDNSPTYLSQCEVTLSFRTLREQFVTLVLYTQFTRRVNILSRN